MRGMVGLLLLAEGMQGPETGWVTAPASVEGGPSRPMGNGRGRYLPRWL